MSEKDSIKVLSSEDRTFPPSKEMSEKAHIGSMEDYEAMYKRSVEDPEGFWAEMAEKNISWFKKWDKVLEYDFHKPEIKWFVGGKLNASYNCLDRHLEAGRKDKTAILWEADDGSNRIYTYEQLHLEVNRFANVLKKNGVVKGDRVGIYMPMIPELAIAMLACARVGAIHSITFGGFSAQALKDRINDCGAKLVITSDQSVRGGKHIPLKINADNAVVDCPTVEKMIVVRHVGDIDMKEGRDIWWHEEMAAGDIEDYCKPEEVDAEDPLSYFIHQVQQASPRECSTRPAATWSIRTLPLNISLTIMKRIYGSAGLT